MYRFELLLFDPVAYKSPLIKFLTNILFTKNHLLNQGDIKLQALFYQSLFQSYTEPYGYNSKEWTVDSFLTETFQALSGQ
ncbi:hypothetical protein D7J84_31260 (plasmid) [Bacillus thuringiensis]|uniref:Uncharacterized protein n=1 Tax=Bacillus thuringiensis TaxID=1428 RepID=A0A9W3VHL3_BACTU|nr:hypothetical protein D7J84_31260 [Bacillus thuringiensis]